MFKGKLLNRVFSPYQAASRKWFPPREGVLRVDVDASVLGDNEAACGGVIRHAQGTWIMGFKRKLGAYPIVIAELLAIQEGIAVCSTLTC